MKPKVVKSTFFKSMFDDHGGGVSYTRVNCAVWSVAVLIIWLIACGVGLTIRYQINSTQLRLMNEIIKTQISLVSSSKTNSVYTTNSVDFSKVSMPVIDNTSYLPTLPDWVVAVLLGFHGYKTIQRFGESNRASSD